ncbi:hypothetical protein QYE76_048632 [Lolium multiflorum]|uniref:non-specific serine/threonine protein kinase n=1 Tax=Lolium multiflorum TaxID=4521 RepID=A0AAD8WHH4_LOLMU|nr:hypothetical protein QYE76_048632 [Lolium multiflorum]
MEKACKFFIAMFICIMSPRCKSAHATDALFPGQALSGNKTLLSKNGAFQLGFNCLSPPCSEFIFGIWYVNSSTCKPLLVWAIPGMELRFGVCDINKNTYLTLDPWKSTFSLSYGNLQLTSLPYNSNIMWSSATGMKDISSSAVAVLLDNGNLVIRDQVNSSVLFWQSFDNLGDTLLPGGWLRPNGQLMYSAKSNVSASISSSLSRNANQPKEFTILRNVDCSTANRIHYSGTFPSWMDFHEDEYSLLLSSNSDLYVRLDSDGTLSAAKLEGCGTLLWSSLDSWQEISYSVQEKSHSKLVLFSIKSKLVLTAKAIGAQPPASTSVDAHIDIIFTRFKCAPWRTIP